jgi:multidrug resistance efflux pump
MKRLKRNREEKQYHLRHLIPIAVWLMAVAFVLWLFHVRSQRLEVVGIARGQIRQVASDAAGRIQKIGVELFQPVKAGQTVAVIDTLLDNQQMLEEELRAQLNTVTAEIQHLTAQLVPTEEDVLARASDLENTRANNERRFSVDVQNARLRILDLQATIASDRIKASDMETEVKICQKLLEDGAIAPYQLEKAKVQYEGLSTKISENEKLLEQARNDLKDAEQRSEQFAEKELRVPTVDYAMDVIRKKIGVQEETMKGLVKRLDALKSRQAVALTSPIDGVIVPIPLQGRSRELMEQRAGEQVMRRPGEVVSAGEAILAVAEEQPTEVVAYVSEQSLDQVRKGMAVDLVRIRAPNTKIAKASIRDIGPTIELMPQRLWRTPNAPQWGLPIVINVPPGLGLVPGETVGVRGL